MEIDTAMNRNYVFIAVLFVGIGIITVLELTDTQQDKSPQIMEELVMSNISLLSMEKVYASGDCADVIQKIKDKHWENINKSKYKRDGKMAWFAAGLVLSAHYVEKDCDTADEILDQYLIDAKIADKEAGQSDIRDDISAAIRYVKSLLKDR